ncbi:MAG: AarF/ABC1/UbiB kinase family protein [Myxococcales bacterium]|nr:AarF/ABC1/UbiB kinase family protein [Myxococcales bacterium]
MTATLTLDGDSGVTVDLPGAPPPESTSTADVPPAAPFVFPKIPLPDGTLSGAKQVLGALFATGKLIGHALGNVERLVIDVARDSLAVAKDAEALYESAVHNAQAVRATARATPRLTAILREAATIAASYRLHRTRAEIVGPESAAVSLRELHSRSAERVYELCVRLRGPILKLAQLASCRPDLLPPEWVTVLSRLQDQVPAVPVDELRVRIEAELGAPLTALFASFDETPLATASLAQVHAATLLDGTRVAVKVQLPGIEELVEMDLLAIRTLLPLLDGLPIGDVRTTVDELARSITGELDFAGEARNLARFAASIPAAARVRVPSVVTRLSTERVLVLELIEGQKLTTFLDDPAQRAHRDALLGRLVESVCHQLLVGGVVHGDLHPGNLLVELAEDGAPTLVFLDFGVVLELDVDRRRALAQLGIALVQDDVAQMTRSFDALGFRTASGAPDTLITIGRQIMAPLRSGWSWDGFDAGRQVQEMLGAFRNDDVVAIPPEMVLLGRAFASVAGLLAHHRPAIDVGPAVLAALGQALSDQSGACQRVGV